MTALADHNSAETAALLARTRDGDPTAAGPLFDRHRARLTRMVDLRLDRRLAGRVNPLDVVRDACSGAAGQLPEYLRAPDEPVFLWLRRRVAERLAALHREHLGTADPGTGLELSLYRDPLPAATPAALAACLLGQQPTATRAGAAVQRVLRVQDGLNALDPLDRELLALRHFEQLTRAEAARALQIDEGMAARRYVRALKKLNDLLAAAGP
jgi:RNA polymerase sigma-70 factor (ECF subfamily)